MATNSLVTRIVNCTFSGNSASGNGSGLYLNPAAAGAATQIVNTIFNHPSKDIYVAATTGNFNNSTKNYGNSCSGVAGAPCLTFDYNSGNSTLGLSGTLANNGGPTQTLELLATSTLRNVGANTATGATVPIKDQRNYSRTDAGIDLGAYERDGIVDDATAPTITYTALTSTMSTSDRTLTATITDVNGGYGFAALAEDLRPRIYFRKNTGAWQSAAGTLASGTGRNGSWNFTISAAAMGGLANGDQVCYYVVAQDVSTVVNIASNPSGATATSVNNITAAPTPNCYNIGSAPSCPTFSGAPANVSISNSTCASACTLSGGSITAPGGTPCPMGSTLQYNVNNSGWTTSLPVYDQDGPAQSIKTRCSCDIDANMVSAESNAVVTIPGTCVTPTLMGPSSVAVNAMITLTGSGTPAVSMPYTSNNTGVATVNSSGVMTGVSEGTAIITYTNASGCTITKMVTVTPAAPSCPTFSTAPANVSITNSSCGSGCTLGGGGITAPTGTPCPAGSTLQYNVNNSGWTTTLPSYHQAGPAQSIRTRCSCDNDANNVSAESNPVSTIPGTLPNPVVPANGSSTVACPSAATTPTPPTVMGCDGSVITPTGPMIVNSPNPVTCEGTRTYTYTYTCGSTSSTWSYVYTIEREPFTVPGNGASTVACLANATAPTLPTVTSNCGETLTPTGPVVTDSPNPLTCEGTRTYAYTYTDCEGNAQVWSYVYTIER
ncbi:MAG TPA: choice-of-anchor Q domain-containing protein, partial [Saprospiraceae bacterium]|nr:choice-of-anchor Q domain-containing protein [Saprospiraceae bacterium]